MELWKCDKQTDNNEGAIGVLVLFSIWFGNPP